MTSVCLRDSSGKSGKQDKYMKVSWSMGKEMDGVLLIKEREYMFVAIMLMEFSMEMSCVIR